MKRHALLVLAFCGLGSAAIACRCISTDDPEKLRQFANEIAKDAVAVVEAETITAYSPSAGGERMRVTRVVAGTAPKEFRVERGDQPSFTSCDLLYAVGQRDVIILYSASRHETAPTYRTSDMCTNVLIDKPVFRDEVVRRIGKPKPPAERG